MCIPVGVATSTCTAHPALTVISDRAELLLHQGAATSAVAFLRPSGCARRKLGRRPRGVGRGGGQSGVRGGRLLFRVSPRLPASPPLPSYHPRGVGHAAPRCATHHRCAPAILAPGPLGGVAHKITPGAHPKCPALFVGRVLAASNNSHSQWHQLGAIVSTARAYSPAHQPHYRLQPLCRHARSGGCAHCNPSRLRTVIDPPAPVWHAL